MSSTPGSEKKDAPSTGKAEKARVLTRDSNGSARWRGSDGKFVSERSPWKEKHGPTKDH